MNKFNYIWDFNWELNELTSQHVIRNIPPRVKDLIRERGRSAGLSPRDCAIMLLDHMTNELERHNLPNALYDIEMAQAVRDIDWAAIGRVEKAMGIGTGENEALSA